MTRIVNLTSGIDDKKKRVYSSKYVLFGISTCTKSVIFIEELSEKIVKRNRQYGYPAVGWKMRPLLVTHQLYMNQNCKI